MADGDTMPLYYFDWKDGVTRRDRLGVVLPNDDHAMQRGEELVLAAAETNESLKPNLRLSIVREDGSEVLEVPVPKQKGGAE